jgi:hypothetical protein
MVLYYVAHRLFAAHDRALGACLAQHIADRFGADSVFIPFCDTDEENLVDECKGRRLFELDRERLRSIDALVALLHGPSLDDGVCMEIGYAAALGVPVIALTTDFQSYGPLPTSGDSRTTFPDPLVDIVVGEILRVHRLGRIQAVLGSDRIATFLTQNLQTMDQLMNTAVQVLAGPLPVTVPLPPPSGQRTAYVEPSPYHTDGMDDVAEKLRVNGWRVHMAARLRDTGRPQAAARADWAALSSANTALVDVRGPETPPGAAMVIGACSATGRPVFARDPGSWWTFADGREPNYRNLMIQYGITGTFTDASDLLTSVNR